MVDFNLAVLPERANKYVLANKTQPFGKFQMTMTSNNKKVLCCRNSIFEQELTIEMILSEIINAVVTVIHLIKEPTCFYPFTAKKSQNILPHFFVNTFFTVL